ncbi:MAG TPA: glycosyltransferase family 2 protein [Anaeromyxobacteraceae bacterium]|nr:glycosyltransferase family 2 protein [Anaeromyxobacteraceae bacterium]
MPVDTWIAIVNWNGARLLPACLASISALARPAHAVVVDNGSSDGSAAVVAGFPAVEWIPLGENRGFAAANNVAVRRALSAGARWIAVVNTDVVLDPGWLDALVAAGEAHPDAAILGGLLLFADDPGTVNSTGLVLDWLGRAFDRDFGVPLADLTTRDGPVAGMTGGAALLRADALRRIGLFDPAFFAYYEDVDLSLRAAAAGFVTWYASGARALHGYGRSFGPGSPRQRYLLARNHLRAMARHMPLGRALATLPAMALLRAGVKAPAELARGRPAHAFAHLRAAGAGALAALEVLGRRVRGATGIPPGAEPTDGPSERG